MRTGFHQLKPPRKIRKTLDTHVFSWDLMRSRIEDEEIDNEAFGGTG
jgi:hypothetical protein